MSKNKRNKQKPGTSFHSQNKPSTHPSIPSYRFEQLYQLIKKRLNEEYHKGEQLIRFVLNKEQFNEEQLITKLVIRILYVQRRLNINQLPSTHVSEQFIDKVLNDEEKSLNNNHFITSLLDDEELIAETLNNKHLKQIIEQVVKRTLVYISFNPNLLTDFRYFGPPSAPPLRFSHLINAADKAEDNLREVIWRIGQRRQFPLKPWEYNHLLSVTMMVIDTLEHINYDVFGREWEDVGIISRGVLDEISAIEGITERMKELLIEIYKDANKLADPTYDKPDEIIKLISGHYLNELYRAILTIGMKLGIHKDEEDILFPKEKRMYYPPKTGQANKIE